MQVRGGRIVGSINPPALEDMPPVPDRGPWRVPPMWQDEVCYILGGGPGLKLVDIEKLRGRRTIAVNQAFKLADWFDILFFGDCRWYDWFTPQINQFPGMKVHGCEHLIPNPLLYVVRKQSAPFGISRNPEEILWNLSSGAAAINLAVHLGVQRIVLLGFDMRRVDGQINWHNDYPEDGREPWTRFLLPFPAIASDLKKIGVECVNATPGSRLTHFPIVSPNEVLQ